MRVGTCLTIFSLALTLGVAGCSEKKSADQGAPATSSPAPAATGEAVPPGKNNAAAMTAGQLKARIEEALKKDAKIAGYRLQVEAQPGNYTVIVKGKAPSLEEKYRAEQVVVDAISDPSFTVDNRIEAGG